MGFVKIGGVLYADGVKVGKGNSAHGKKLSDDEVARLRKKKPEAMSADRSRARNMTSARANEAARNAAEKESSDG